MMQNLRFAALRLWNHLTWMQRITLAVLSGAVLTAVALLAMWANTPSYGILFGGLSSQDAGAIVTQLNSDKVPYQLANGGSTILVPQSDVDSERLSLANQGLPQGGTVGWELFDKSNIFQGDSASEQINYTRALEGELDRTIGQIQGVVYDRVNIVIPQQQLFTSDPSIPTASVLLKLGPGGALSGDQIAGVQHLVAGSVQDLKPENVTVVDGSGQILSNNDIMGGTTTAGMTALGAEARYASNLEAQITAMLDTVVGPDKAVVRVQDSMDWTQRDITSNVYAPQASSSPLSQAQATTSTALGPGSTVGGIPGLASNVPQYGTTGISSTTGSRQTEQTVNNTYANSNTVSHIVTVPGQVTHLSVAVLLDGVPPTETAPLRQAVFAAAGMRPGDQLTLTSLPFDQSVATAAAAAAAQAQQQALIMGALRWLALILVPLLLLFLLRRLLVSSRLKEYDASEYPDIEVLEEGQALLPAGAAPALAAPLKSREPSLARQSMAEMAREKPEMVAGLIGRWIEEDR